MSDSKVWVSGLLALGALLSGSACGSETRAAVGRELGASVLSDVDKARVGAALRSLEQSECARQQAAERAERLDPGTPEIEHEPLDAVIEACEVEAAGENLARIDTGEAASAEEIVREWMDSPGHRANILDPTFTSVGVACTDEVPVRCSAIFLGPLR